MANIAIVEKYPSNYNYASLFPFEFDTFHLVDQKQEKVLKRDVTLDMEEIKGNYEYLILVGKEACKYIADIRSVTEYQGYLVEEKYLALMNPMAVKLRPSLSNAFDKAKENIIETITGNVKHKEFNYKVKAINTELEAAKFILDLKDLVDSGQVSKIAMDSETTALYPRDGYVLGLSISYKKETGVYIDSMALTDDILLVLQDIINKVTVLFFNAKFDMKMFKYHFNLDFPNWEDVMLIHYSLDENSPHSLKTLCIKYTDLGDYDAALEEFKKDYCKRHNVKIADFTYDLIPFEILSVYAALDAAGTYELYHTFWPHLIKNEKIFNVYKNILKEGTIFLNKVEENGIPVNKEFIETAKDDIDNDILPLEEELYSYKEVKEVEKEKGQLFNVNSPKHIQSLLFDKLKLPVLKQTATGNPSADAEVLEELATMHKLPAIINDIKKLKSIKSKYLNKMIKSVDRDGRIRTGFNLHTTTSGRLSSSGKLNAQQFPRKAKVVKQIIEARPGYKIISQDLKTAEMYVASVLSGDKNLQKVFTTGVDYHGYMAVAKFGLDCSPNEVADKFPDLRQAAKTISFEILYKLNYREPALENFKALKKWLKNQEEFIKDNGFIYSILGRKRRVSDVFSPNRQEAQHHVRSAVNFLVQSVSSDINLIAGIKMQKWIEENNYQDDMKIFGLVHDSILAEVKEELVNLYVEKLAKYTQEDIGCSIPNHPIGLDLEIGNNYAFI